MIQTLFGSLDEEQKPSFIERMKEAVSRTRENLAERIEEVVSIGKEIDRSTLDDLEATLIGADLAARDLGTAHGNGSDQDESRGRSIRCVVRRAAVRNRPQDRLRNRGYC